MNSFTRLLQDEAGTTVFEYALISCIITVAALGAVVALGVQFLTLLTA